MQVKTYIGLTGDTFKARFTQHTHSFRNVQRMNATSLSKYVWYLKERGVTPTIKWSIVARASKYKGGRGRCNLCLMEKLSILTLQADMLNNVQRCIYSVGKKHDDEFTGNVFGITFTDAVRCSQTYNSRRLGEDRTKSRGSLIQYQTHFRDQRLKNVTSLAKLIHRFKDRKKKYKVSWRILCRRKSYAGGVGNVIYV